MSLGLFSTFILASILLALAPGPDNIFVLTQSAQHGRRAGLLVTLGLTTGLLLHTGLVAFGVAALFTLYPFAFTGLKLLGAAYLLFLAWKSWSAAAQGLPSEQLPTLSSGQYYLRGIIMNVTNPKVAIFFLAFLPQFTDPQQGSLVLQFLVLGAVFMLVTLLVFGSIAWLAGSLGQWFNQSPRGQHVLNVVAACVFVLLAIRLVIPDSWFV
ncbi:MAG: LysE family translocator [Pseudomonadales bacterium]